nr:hypothetical protein [Escherichia coli]
MILVVWRFRGPVYHVCQLVALITIGLLFIGVLNAPINAYEMVIYPIAFFVCLFGQMRLFRSA